MSFDWSEYARLAEELSGQTPTAAAKDEARRRAAISRAYYAALMSVRNFVEAKDKIPVGANEVHRLADRLMASRDDTRKKIGSDLDRLRTDRNKADYKNDLKDADKMATQAVLLCNGILGSLARL